MANVYSPILRGNIYPGTYLRIFSAYLGSIPRYSFDGRVLVYSEEYGVLKRHYSLE